MGRNAIRASKPSAGAFAREKARNLHQRGRLLTGALDLARVPQPLDLVLARA